MAGCHLFYLLVCTVYCSGNRLKINITPYGESSTIQLTDLLRDTDSKKSKYFLLNPFFCICNVFVKMIIVMYIFSCCSPKRNKRLN